MPVIFFVAFYQLPAWYTHIKQFVNIPSQVGPWKLPTHSHENESPSTVQIPLFLQGFESHGVGLGSILKLLMLDIRQIEDVTI
jgi:hypothetical protein